MGNYLFDKFLEECVVDLQKVILSNGVYGLLGEFECWLERNNLIDALNKEMFFRENRR